ncbi:ABC transporter permease [Corynebacterium pseudotuberculosis]|uniref:ABC transporter permease n=1 Tax=Corynebacterium pseudotuberculosis TaxID=1719 RepID=UPI0007192696|nr:ABC transporter permease [Corynebacterium pseudotuberculosis]ALP34215.1 Oligopeptide transport system permease OppB [Corynebacterium pseudotuberculosis]ALR34153.1 membrane protein [Corynebacterium pseudotuberculosis]APX36521.1 ABC transporter permease [Corynebacterium pseudotuberculosis]APX37694.1 ABC transporter permease [Corynebacterium pseudotuberculosis]AQL51671.1 Dipeptide transport system permease protein DppB [Corynebacterium pseudotuberculosis]
MIAAKLARGAAKYVFTLFIASVVIFVALRIVPGNPAEVALGVTATPEAVAKLSATMGIDKPLWEQYVSWTGGLLRGEFGTSLTSSTDISSIVADRLQVSLILVVLSMLFALVLAIPLGLWAARRSGHVDGTFISALSQVGIAVPSFLAAILFISFFAVRLRWLPTNGWSVPNEDFSGFLARLVLPVISLGIVQAAIMTRYVRAAVMDVMREDFMRTARAIGLSSWQALRSHGLRNAASPVLTVTGLQLTSLLVGAVVIERVFVIPGLGSLLLTAVTNRDLPTVQTIVMILVVLAIVINAIVDMAYVVVDPRTRKEA